MGQLIDNLELGSGKVKLRSLFTHALRDPGKLTPPERCPQEIASNLRNEKWSGNGENAETGDKQGKEDGF